VPLNIRPATLADASQIADFNRRLAEESEAKHLDTHTVLAGVTALLGNPAHGQYYLADDGVAVIGQLLITYEWSDWRNAQFWWIQSVYVPPQFRRRGVFSSLYAHIAELARRDPGVCGLRLYVEEHNASALATYGALGLGNAGYRVMEIELS
jgi:ribosomal protein S18 acetylase RimI-like enzyme